MAGTVVVALISKRKDAVHADPVWRDRANFIIGAALPEEDRAEQLWARQVGEGRFEICCIPFFLYNVALGDLVETDAEYNIVRVVEPSGRYVFRAWFGESTHPREEITAQLADLDALMEWSSPNLLAIDASGEAHANKIADFLARQQQFDRLIFETGRS